MDGFNSNAKRENAASEKATSFLAQAKHEHAELFRQYLANQGEFADLEEYSDGLQADAWSLTEQIAKRSYRNGIARGRSAKSSAK